jgi:hypothetical protein
LIIFLVNLPSKYYYDPLTMKSKDKLISEYFAKVASKGGKARAAKYDKKTLSKWAKKGGRPRKSAK